MEAKTLYDLRMYSILSPMQYAPITVAVSDSPDKLFNWYKQQRVDEHRVDDITKFFLDGSALEFYSNIFSLDLLLNNQVTDNVDLLNYIHDEDEATTAGIRKIQISGQYFRTLQKFAKSSIPNLHITVLMDTDETIEVNTAKTTDPHIIYFAPSTVDVHFNYAFKEPYSFSWHVENEEFCIDDNKLDIHIRDSNYEGLMLRLHNALNTLYNIYLVEDLSMLNVEGQEFKANVLDQVFAPIQIWRINNEI